MEYPKITIRAEGIESWGNTHELVGVDWTDVSSNDIVKFGIEVDLLENIYDTHIYDVLSEYEVFDEDGDCEDVDWSYMEDIKKEFTEEDYEELKSLIVKRMCQLSDENHKYLVTLGVKDGDIISFTIKHLWSDYDGVEFDEVECSRVT